MIRTKDLLVVMAATKETEGMERYVQQLQDAGIGSEVSLLGRFEDNLGKQLKTIREKAEEFSEYRNLIFSDAFDVQFFGSKEDVLRKIPWDGVVLAAERNCYPDSTLAPHFKEASPWKFVNGGLSAGTPKSFLRWADEIEAHPYYDARLVNQSLFNRMAMDGSLPGKLDTHTSLFYCLYGEKDELGFQDGMPINKVYGTRPNFLHANGNSQWPSMNGQQLFLTKFPVTVNLGIELCKECKDRLEGKP